MPSDRVMKAFKEGRHRPKDPVQVTIAAGGGLLIARNPNRTQLVIQDGTGAVIAARPWSPAASVAAGYRIEANGKVTQRVDEDGDAVGAEWYVYSAAGGTVTATEWVAVDA